MVKLVYDEDFSSPVGLADAMELLSQSIKTPKFREATAFVMGLQAIDLLNKNLNPAPVEKLLKRAQAIYPDSDMVKNTLIEIDFRKVGDEMNKAFKQQKPIKAAMAVKRSGDSRHIEYYFDVLGKWYRSVQGWEAKERLAVLREIFQGCCIVDGRHTLTVEIHRDIKALEE